MGRKLERRHDTTVDHAMYPYVFLSFLKCFIRNQHIIIALFFWMQRPCLFIVIFLLSNCYIYIMLFKVVKCVVLCCYCLLYTSRCV